MASPVAAFSSSGSGDSCKASLLNIVTKSEMRYEGFIYNINFHDATIGLKNVRSFGTEGRRKDGPEVLPDGRVFEYVQFSENDIKDLQVFQSSAPQNVSSVLDDPAIIQTHYTPPALTSKSAPYASSQSMANLSMGGLQNLAVKGIILLLSPFRNLESTHTLLAPPRGQMNTSEIQLRVQGSEGPSTGIPFVEQQSLVGSAQGLTAMYPMKQQMHHHAFNYSIPSSTSNPDEPSRSLILPVSLGSLISVPNSVTLPGFPNSPLLSSLISPSMFSDCEHNIIPTIMPSPTTSFVSPLTPMDLERSSSMPIATDKPNFTVCSIFQTFLSADGVSTSCNTEELKLSSVVTGLRSPTEPANCPSPQSLEIILDDVDAIKVLTSESHSISSKGDKAPDLLVRAAPSRKGTNSSSPSIQGKKPQLCGGDMKGGVNVPSYECVRSNPRKVWRKIDGNSTHAHQISKGSSKQIVVKKDGTDVISWENLRGRSMERGKKTNRTMLWVAKNKGEPCAQETGKKDNSREALCTDFVGTKGGQRRVATVITHSTELMEDFDFEAMNRKFKKDEIWGDLGKLRNQLKAKDEKMMQPRVTWR